MTAAGVPPVRKEIIVATTPERAFRVFTDGIDKWWPRQHHIGSSPLAREVLETRLGGRWFGVSQDGTECDIGKVVGWDPPHSLVLTWQITAEWKFDPGFITEIEVTFTPHGEGSTQVVLEHRELHRYGVAATEIRNTIDKPEGWGIVLEQFAAAAVA